MSYSVTREELGQLEAEWRSLIPRSTVRNVFITPLWLKTWWEEFASGRRLLLLAVRQGEQLIGVAPLMGEDERLTFAGDTQICDYMDFTVVRGAEEGFAHTLMRSLDIVAAPPGRAGWRELVLWAVPQYSPTLQTFPAAAQSLGYSVEVEREDVCPRVLLPATWEDYLGGLNKKDRHELRRKLRRLTRGGAVRLEILKTADQVAAALDDFLRLHVASRVEKARFMTEEMARFFRRMVMAVAAEGLVRLCFLTLDGRRAAAFLCFEGEGELLLYNSGYDPAFSGLSVGIISKALAVQWAIEQGKERFDFLRGAEPYKYDLGAQDLPVYRLSIRRP